MSVLIEMFGENGTVVIVERFGKVCASIFQPM